MSMTKMGTVAIGDLSLEKDLNLSLCNVNSFSTVQCSHGVWNQNPLSASESVSGNVKLIPIPRKSELGIMIMFGTGPRQRPSPRQMSSVPIEH